MLPDRISDAVIESGTIQNSSQLAIFADITTNAQLLENILLVSYRMLTELGYE
jgi:hypothetical protein